MVPTFFGMIKPTSMKLNMAENAVVVKGNRQQPRLSEGCATNADKIVDRILDNMRNELPKERMHVKSGMHLANVFSKQI